MNSTFTKASNRSNFSSSHSSTHTSSFCSNENFSQALAFLDQELSIYGYPSIQSAGALNKVALVNVTYDLLLNYRKSLEAHSEATDELKIFENNAARSQHLLSLAKEDAANKDRELKSKCIEEAHLQQRIESLRKKYKTEQDKCRKMLSDLASRDSQYKHEKKKKIQEIEKLQGKLHQLLQDKRHERLVGIELLNSLQRTDGKRGKWNTDKNKKNNEQEMYRLIITNYEDSQRQLVSENADMRKYLKQMQDELIAALNEKVLQSDSRRSSLGSPTKDESRRGSFDSEKTSNSEDSELSLAMSEGVFEMPYSLVKEDIEKSLKSKWKALRKMHKRIKTDDRSRRGDSLRGVTDLTKQFEEYDKVIKEQQEVIEYFTSCQDGKKASIPKDVYFLEEKAELEKTKSRFYHQRLAFEKNPLSGTSNIDDRAEMERKIYTEGLLQLGHDRQEFEHEKAKWLQSKFLQLSPFRENSTLLKSSISSNLSSTRHKGLSSSWNEGIKASLNDVTLRSSRGEADGMGHSAASPAASSPALTAKSPNLRQYYSSPEQGNPWLEESPPVPSTCELYRALGLRYYDKENQDSNSGNKLLFPLTPNPSSAWSDFCLARRVEHPHSNGTDPPPPRFQAPNRQSFLDLDKDPGCCSRSPFSRSASIDSMLSYHTPVLGQTPDDKGSASSQV